MKTLQKRRIFGFTVIELMIVLVIVAIIMALAYPSYVNYTRKAKRGEAQQQLMNWAINQEIFRSNNPSYADEDSTVLPGPVHPDGYYAYLAWATMGTEASCGGAATDAPSATAYWLVATASGDQANDVARNGDSCATLCMASSGVKQPAACWE